jgi:hypothetical protein
MQTTPYHKELYMAKCDLLKVAAFCGFRKWESADA